MTFCIRSRNIKSQGISLGHQILYHDSFPVSNDGHSHSKDTLKTILHILDLILPKQWKRKSRVGGLSLLGTGNRIVDSVARLSILIPDASIVMKNQI